MEENPGFVDDEIGEGPPLLNFSLTEMSLLIRILKMISTKRLHKISENEQDMNNTIKRYSEKILKQVGISNDFFRTLISKKFNKNMNTVNF